MYNLVTVDEQLLNRYGGYVYTSCYHNQSTEDTRSHVRSNSASGGQRGRVQPA